MNAGSGQRAGDHVCRKAGVESPGSSSGPAFRQVEDVAGFGDRIAALLRYRIAQQYRAQREPDAEARKEHGDGLHQAK